MVLLSGCKINIGLYLTHKRTDGYHEINTIFYPIPFYDVLESVTSPYFALSTTGIKIDAPPEENLCVKAYNLLRHNYVQLPNIKLHLHKNIPSGAGLGGGSANATNTMQLLNMKYKLQINKDKLQYYAAQLGSDCAFFINNTPAYGTGRGEIVNPIALNLVGYTLVLIMPGLHISTTQAFAGINPAMPAYGLLQAIEQPIGTWKNNICNQFEKTVFAQHPILLTYKNMLYKSGAVYASMSGSGSTVYGIFDCTVAEVARLLPQKIKSINHKVIGL